MRDRLNGYRIDPVSGALVFVKRVTDFGKPESCIPILPDLTNLSPDAPLASPQEPLIERWLLHRDRVTGERFFVLQEPNP